MLECLSCISNNCWCDPITFRVNVSRIKDWVCSWDYCNSLYCGMQSKIVLELTYKTPEGSRGGVGDRERGGNKEAGM